MHRLGTGQRSGNRQVQGSNDLARPLRRVPLGTRRGRGRVVRTHAGAAVGDGPTSGHDRRYVQIPRIGLLAKFAPRSPRFLSFVVSVGPVASPPRSHRRLVADRSRRLRASSSGQKRGSEMTSRFRTVAASAASVAVLWIPSQARAQTPAPPGPPPAVAPRPVPSGGAAADPAADLDAVRDEFERLRAEFAEVQRQVRRASVRARAVADEAHAHTCRGTGRRGPDTASGFAGLSRPRHRSRARCRPRRRACSIPTCR